MKILKNNLEKLLKKDDRLWDDEKNVLNETLLKDLSDKLDEKLIDLLLNNPETRKKFFLKVKDVYVFKNNDFKFFLDENKIDNSFTNFKNIIGLSDGKKFLKDTNDVVLNWPYKDCVLEGGQSTEEGEDVFFEWKDDSFKDKLDENGNKIKDGRKYLKEIDVPGHYDQKQAKRKEIFFNEVLAQDEIDRLFDDKALVNWKRFTKDGEQEIIPPSVKGGRGIFKRDKNGTIKENLIIKGNNLLALHSLKKQFAGKVKLIYIDPPYNTGNDGFKYNDNFNHSTWLSFMKNRLEIAKKLLREDGTIFVQCDDNEQAYLKVLMDEIFGRDNFITTITIVSDARVRNYEALSKTHEFICVYSKTISYKLYQAVNKDKKFKYTDSNGGFDIYELRNRNIQFNSKNRPNLLYPFFLNINNADKNGFYEISLKKQKDWIKVFPTKSQDVQTVWRWCKEKAEKNLNTVLVGKKSTGGYQIVKKYRENVSPFSSVWNDKKIITDRGTLQIKALFDNKKVFGYPKAEELLNRILELSTKPNDIVLDFHLGSGTTAAVAHKMGRQYIGIEQMNYIETVAVERLKKVIGIEKKEKDSLVKELEYDKGGISKSVNWQGGGDFIYFELAKWNEKAKEEILACKNLEELEKLFDVLYEKYFLNYNLKIKDFKEKVIKAEEFINLKLEEQKKMFLTMLDLNQMYVQKTEMSDKKFGLSEKDQKLTEEFYK